MAETGGFRQIFRTLANPNFGIFTGGHSVSIIGTWMQRIAVGWLAWQMTGSPAWLGALAFANLGPSVFIGPVASVLADRKDRLRVVFVTQCLAMGQAVALFGFTASGMMTIELLFALVLFQGIVQSFSQPSRKALIANLVPHGDLPTAVAINSITWNLARFIGPALAGILIAASGVAAAFAVNAASTLVFLLALTKVRVDPTERFLAQAKGGSWFGQMADGVRYVTSHPGIRMILLLATAVSLCARPMLELLPGFAAQVFGGGAETLALLTSTLGVGAVAAGLSLAQRGSHQGLTHRTLYSVAGIALSILAFVASDSIWIGVAAMACLGFFMVSVSVGIQILLQLAVAPSMRGRVMGFHGMIFRGVTAIGALFLGAISEWVGLRWSMAAATLILIVIWMAIARRHGAVAGSLDRRLTISQPNAD